MTMRYGYDPSEVELEREQQTPVRKQAPTPQQSFTMRQGYDPGELEELRRTRRRQTGYSPWIGEQARADVDEFGAGMESAARFRESQRPAATAMPQVPAGGYQPYMGASRQEAQHPFFPGEPTNVPYQPPMFNQSPIWNTQPGQAGYADMGYSINPMNPMWNPPWQPPSPTNYYPNDPNLQGVNRVFTPQEMNPNTAAGLLQQYGNPFFQQIGAQPYSTTTPTGMGAQPGVSSFMMDAIRRAM
ncbi:uncharacterized protein METZ01_LOCUS437749, partial [marine metagenome]